MTPGPSVLLPEVYRRLYRAYGPQGWWPGDGPFDVVVGAILTQSTAWRNVELAIVRMKRANLWSLNAIHRCPEEDLAAAFGGVGVVDIGTPCPERLDLGAGEPDAHLERSFEMVIAARLAVLRDSPAAGGGVATHCNEPSAVRRPGAVLS